MISRSPFALVLVATFAFACGGTSTTPDTYAADVPDAPGDALPGDVPDEATPDVPADVPADTLPDVPFNPPACGSGTAIFRGLIPGPAEAGFDADLEAKATTYERVWQAFNASAMHLNTDVTVPVANLADRTKIGAFALEPTAWDFEAFSGVKASDVIASQHKVAGLYGGDGVAADAYRYAVLRDQGYPCADVQRARQWLLGDLDALHTVVDITGAPGVIVRGIARRDLPGDGATVTLVPLKDEQGNPLPATKNNGVWREDFSGGKYENLVWEDSVSRDMYIGWVAAYAAVWDVIRQDPDFPKEKKDRLQADALAVARQLMVVRDSGYDLEIPDADGRTTLHGWINEHNFDGVFYSDDYYNGFHSVMALGVVGAFVYITDDPELKAFLYDQLIGERRLHEIVRDHLFEMVDMGTKSNYSNYNMAFQGVWLSLRYLADGPARTAVQQGLKDGMYDRPDSPSQPKEFGYSLYDYIYAEGMADGSAWWPQRTEPDAGAVARGTQSLVEFQPAPYYDFGVAQCPDAVCTEAEPQVASEDCTALDGVTHFTVLGCVGRNADLITLEPVPMRLLGPSNFRWRSNPYMPNFGGSGDNLLPGVDFRIAYWMGRYFRRPAL